MQVKWYCPVGSKERLGNKADLMRYWRKHHGHDRVPSCFNFLAKDVPSWCKRLNGIEEEAVRSSYGGGSQGRGTLTYVGALVSPNPLSAVVTPKLATKVSSPQITFSRPAHTAVSISLATTVVHLLAPRAIRNINYRDMMYQYCQQEHRNTQPWALVMTNHTITLMQQKPMLSTKYFFI